MKSSSECYKILPLSWYNFGAAATATLIARTIPVNLEPDSPGVGRYNVYIEQYNSINYLTATVLDQVL